MEFGVRGKPFVPHWSVGWGQAKNVEIPICACPSVPILADTTAKRHECHPVPDRLPVVRISSSTNCLATTPEARLPPCVSEDLVEDFNPHFMIFPRGNLVVLAYIRQFARPFISQTSLVQTRNFSFTFGPRGTCKMADGDLVEEYGKRAKLAVSASFITSFTLELVL